MATNGITDVFATISVPKPEYEELIRENEQNRIIRRALVKNGYVTAEGLKAVLGISEETEGRCEE